MTVAGGAAAGRSMAGAEADGGAAARGAGADRGVAAPQLPGLPPGLLIKICGITSEADALLAVGLGADAIGFIFAPSPRQMSPRAVQRIVERVPGGVLTVGVFRDEAPARVVEVVNTLGLGAAQLHGTEGPDDCQWVAERVPMVIKAFPVGHPGLADALGSGASLVLVDAASPGSGQVFDWRVAEGVVDPARLVVAGGLTPANVAAAVAALGPRGVDVATGVESSPGRKDPRLVRAFVAAARRAVAAQAGDGGGGIPGACGMPGGSPDDGAPFDWMADA